MIEITWSITSVEVDSNNGVVNVNWLAVGNLDGHKEAEKGTAEFRRANQRYSVGLDRAQEAKGRRNY